MYTRQEYPRQNLANAAHRFGEILEPMITIGQRMRIAPAPVWTNFERRDPGIGPLPPNTDAPLDQHPYAMDDEEPLLEGPRSASSMIFFWFEDRLFRRFDASAIASFTTCFGLFEP